MNTIKMLGLTLAIFSSLLSITSYAKPETGEEYQAVVQTAYNYLNGAVNGDQALLAKAFDLESEHVKMISLDKTPKKKP